MRCDPPRRVKRSATIRCSGLRLGRVGEDSGRDDRSRIPASPEARYRSAHFFPVAGEQLNRSAARPNGQRKPTTSSPTPNPPSRKRPVSDKGALRWDTRPPRNQNECGNPLRYRRSSPPQLRPAAHNLLENYNKPRRYLDGSEDWVYLLLQDVNDVYNGVYMLESQFSSGIRACKHRCKHR